jgi:hypothetical protein
MKRLDWCKPLDASPRSADELIADLIEGAGALVGIAKLWNPESVTAADTASASATLVELLRTVKQLRRARNGQ